MQGKSCGKTRFVRRFLAVWLAVMFFATPLHANPLIRDAEIEHTLKQMAQPIFAAAGLKPSAVHIYIVQSDSINAFVAGGSNIFLHTGLILRTPTPDMLIGVIAHETGHIAGGHLAKGSEKLKDAQIGTILSYIAGAAAAVATQKAGAAAAVIGIGENTVGRNFLAFTRAHEEAADQAALGYLDKLGISASGLVKVFSMLQRHERERISAPDPYLLTHPLSALRIEHVRNHVMNSSIPEDKYPPEFDMMHKRMVAKLYGFLESPERTMQRYPMSDKSVPARMARAVAYYKMPDIARATIEMDGLLAELPNDPFLHELKGQILFENGRIPEALASYEQAIKLRPDSPLILTELGKVEMAQNNDRLASAVSHLEKANRLDNSNPQTWHLLSIAYGKSGNIGMASLAQAERSALTNDYDMALQHVGQALLKLNQGTPAYQRAQDLKAYATQVKEKQKEEERPF